MKQILKLALGILLASTSVSGATIFSDNFSPSPSSQWGNQLGAWAASGGGYFATLPSNNPTTYTLLPYVLSDFEVNVDVNGASDGGIWLRSDATRDNAVLLVIGGYLHSGTGFYWHTIQGGSFSGVQNSVSGLFAQGSNIHVRATVSGDTYSVYFNGNPTAASTLTTHAFGSGLTGLYDFTGNAYGHMSFHNYELTAPNAAPEPASVWLVMTGLAGLGGILRRRQRS